jgi:uncharacterized integral membrane protein
MSYRLNALAITSILIVLMLLINNHRVQVQVLFVSTLMPLGAIMSLCIATGVGLTFLFLSISRSYLRLVRKKINL